MGEQQPEAAAAAAGGGATCNFCTAAPAVVYCRADAAKLCLSCDRHVHAANSVCSRHSRALLCDSCRAAPAAFLLSSLLLCSNCDFDARPDALLDRRSVEPFSGCPTAAELASNFGVAESEKSAGVEEGGDGGVTVWPFAEEEWVWETAPVFSMEDLIVPTTSSHGFQAMGIPPLPKNRSFGCGKQKEEILRQLRELIRSENRVNIDCGDPDPVVEFKPLDLDQLGDSKSDVNQDAACTVVPSYEHGNTLQWNHSDCHNSKDIVTFFYEELIGSSSLVNSSLPNGITDIHSSANYAKGNERDQVPSATNEITSSLPPRGGLELCADRDSVISRYKEKRKTRRYDKHVRYESRKARADSRMRVKGRFAKGNGRTDT